MGIPHKVVTCCYCGSRAALSLKGKDSHELSCSSCGAPLHNLKMLRLDRTGDRELVDRRQPAFAKAPKPSKKAYKADKAAKKRKSRRKSFFEEAFDLIEDIFD